MLNFVGGDHVENTKAPKSGRGNHHKRRLIELLAILRHETDRNNRLTMRRLLERLGLEQTEANMRDVRLDVRVLKEEGIPVKIERHTACEYYLGERLLAPGELQAIVNIVQSSRSISLEKSDDLITSLLSLASESEASEIRKGIRLGNRARTDNTEVFDNIEVIMRAMQRSPRHKVSFLYFSMDPYGARIYHDDGQRVEETPVILTHMDDKFYLITYSDGKKRLTTRRIDRMEAVSDTGNRGAWASVIDSFDLTTFERSQFGMFIGDTTRVRMLAGDKGANVLYDRFGEGMRVVEERPDGSYLIEADVTVSQQFYGWARGLAGLIEVIEPQDVRDGCYERVDPDWS